MGEFLYSFRCCSNPGGRCPALRLLLILRRLTDIQSELVLYWKISADSSGLWAKRTGGVKRKGVFESKWPLGVAPPVRERGRITEMETCHAAIVDLCLQNLHPGLFSNPHAVAERRNCIKRWMFGHTGLFFTRLLFTWAVHPSPHLWRLYVYVITVLN